MAGSLFKRVHKTVVRVEKSKRERGGPKIKSRKEFILATRSKAKNTFIFNVSFLRNVLIVLNLKPSV